MRSIALVILLLGCARVLAQSTVFFQGFETGAACNAWGYTGGNTNTETARTGTTSLRVGRAGQSNLVTFNTLTISELAGVRLSLHHFVHPIGALPSTNGEGMDVDEGAVVQVQLNGGAWTTIGSVSGFSNTSWGWGATTGGNGFSGCLNTMPNPLLYDVPAGTNTFALRVFSTRGGCPGTTAANYDRTDEGFFIDDVRLTTTTTPLPFIWSGNVDTDWNKCANWRYRAVPTATSVVLIDQSAVGDCEVYTAPNAACASLVLSSNSAVARNLTVRLNRQLNVGGPVTVQRSAAGAAMGITLNSGTFTSNGLQLVGTTLGARHAFCRNESSVTNNMLVRGPVTIAVGGLLDLQGAGIGGIMRIEGDYTNNDGEAAFEEVSSQVYFVGANAQSINTAGFEERFGSIRMGKTAGVLTLNAPISLRAALTLTSPAPGGIIFSSATNLLTLESTSTTAGASDACHVNGPVRKFGTANITFPVGKGGNLRTCTLTAITGAATDAFTAEYFMASPRTTFNDVKEPTLDHISDCEYWMIERAAGNANAVVTLSWDTPESCGVTDLPDLRVARWDGAIWRDRGNGGTTGTTVAGTIRTLAAQELLFSPWTLASISGENPLPVTLLRFDAVPDRATVACSWVTLTERNSDYFTVQRSANGQDFVDLGRVAAAGDSWAAISYGFVDDAPLRGTSYYRLKQVDLDGTSTYSNVVAVQFVNGADLRIMQGSDHVLVAHELSETARYVLHDATGRIVTEGRAVPRSFELRLDAVPSGVYLISIYDAGVRHTLRFVR